MYTGEISVLLDVFSEGVKVIMTGVSFEDHAGIIWDIMEELGQKYHGWGNVGRSVGASGLWRDLRMCGWSRGVWTPLLGGFGSHEGQGRGGHVQACVVLGPG